MIVFNLLTRKIEHAKEAGKIILEANFAMQIFMDEAISEFHLEDSNMVEGRLYRIIFITKAMLFDDIEYLLNTHFPDNSFRLYSTPITQLDAREADKIRTILPSGQNTPKPPIKPS
jgi:hypothetical protein